MRSKKFLFVIMFFTLTFSFLTAQTTRQGGSIRGIVTEAEGAPLPGVRITVSGPSLQGVANDITMQDGAFRIPFIPPGTYTVLAELEGFQAQRRVDVIVNVGMIVTINFEMQQSTLEEAVTVTATSPVVDIRNTKIAGGMTTEVMQRLPLPRSLGFGTAVEQTVAGYVDGAIHGGTGMTSSYEVDGVNIDNTATMGAFVSIQYDAIDEVEVITGGLPATVGNTGGAFINVVTKSGGNEFHGQAIAYYTNENLSNILFTDEQLLAMKVGKPVAPIYDFDTSAVLGGPIIKDRLWFFGDLAFLKYERHTVFVPTTIQGVSYRQYPDKQTTIRSMLKLTAQINKNLKFFTLFNYDNQQNPWVIFGSPAATTTEEATLDYERYRTLWTGNLTWILSRAAILDFRLGNTTYWLADGVQRGTEKNISYEDAFTGYYWGSASRFDERYSRPSKQASVRFTGFQDNFLGGDHELGLGIEYQRMVNELSYWRYDPTHLRLYNGNPYYYRAVYGLNGPHPFYGDGYVYFNICSQNKDKCLTPSYSDRIGAYVQDAFTIKNRLTINAGLRFDYTTGNNRGGTKEASGGIAPAVGAAALEPIYGINPFGEITIDDWKKILSWKVLSPRIGITYDLFGTGKTAIKASFSQYYEAMPTVYYSGVHPFTLRSFAFNWWDLNKNQIPDAPPLDKYELQGASPITMLPSYYKNSIDTTAKAPRYDEITFSIFHELFPNFRIGLQYISKKRYDYHETVLWDGATGRYWYTYERAPDWWIPFKTIVPAYGGFPEKEVTLYFMSKNAPWNNQFTKFTTIPEDKRAYDAFEITFDKRLLHGWSLGGSIVFSKTMSYHGGGGTENQGWSGAFDNASWWVNRYGRDNTDRPLVIKLYGTFSLPLGFVGSFYFTHFDGLPWNRTVTVYPPAAWAAANNAMPYSYTINVEEKGSRRNPGLDNVDLRLEKEFVLGKYGKLGIFLDVFNLLGSSLVTMGMDTGGNWRPTDINSNKGSYTADSWFGRVRAIAGVRNYKLSVRFTF